MNQIPNLKHHFPKDIMNLTWPVIAEQTFLTAIGVINAIISGHISKEAVAAIGMVDSINTIFITVFSALSIGSTVVAAHYKGQNNLKNVQAVSQQSFWITLVISLAVTLLLGLNPKNLLQLLYNQVEPSVLGDASTYFQITLLTYPFMAITSAICGILRGTGDTKTPAKAIILMNILNVALSYPLIYGLHWGACHFESFGIQGAAWGIALARICGAVFLSVILFKNLNLGSFKQVLAFKANPEILRAIFSIGLPASMESLLFSIGKLVTQTYVAGMGTAALAANYIGFSIQTLVLIPGNSLGVTATTMVGQALGKGDRTRASKILAKVNQLGFIPLVALNLLICLPLADWLASLYTQDPETIRLSALLTRLSIPFYAVWPWAWILPAGLKGAGDANFTLKVSLLSMWLVRVTLGYLLGIVCHLGLAGVWMGMFLDWVVRGSCFYWRFKSGQWHKNTIAKYTEEAA